MHRWKHSASSRRPAKRPAPVRQSAAPTAALAPFVASLGYARSASTRGFDRCLGTGTATIEINLADDEYRLYDEQDQSIRHTSGAVVVGPTFHSTTVDRAGMGHAMSVTFKLGGAAAFLRAPAWTITDQVVDVGELLGRRGAVLREQLLEQPTPAAKLAALHDAIAAHVAATEPDRAIRRAALLLRLGHSVAATAEAVGLTHRTLTRRFKSETGLTPKQYARGSRLQGLIDYINQHDHLDWAEAASVNGYYDQSHLVHDFRELTGLTPREYAPREHGAPRHVPLPVATAARAAH